MADVDRNPGLEQFRALARQLEGVQVKDLTARHRAALAEAFNQGKAVMSAGELYDWFSRAAQIFVDAEQWQLLAPKYEAMADLIEAAPEPDRPCLARVLHIQARIQAGQGEDCRI